MQVTPHTTAAMSTAIWKFNESIIEGHDSIEPSTRQLDQSRIGRILTGDPEGSVGHIAPIGAYDAKKKRVLILDPDRKYYQPYWVPYEKLFDGINTTDSGNSKSRGLVIVSH